jgi:hypothetical protein
MSRRADELATRNANEHPVITICVIIKHKEIVVKYNSTNDFIKNTP